MEEYLDFKELYKGLKESCRNVRWKDSVVGYESNALKNTLKLKQDILEGKYKIQPYQKFTIYEPKERKIVATRLRDRQFQRAMCNNGVYEQLTKSFIYDNRACLKGKGLDFAQKRLKVHLQKHYRKFGCDGYYLKCDIKHYFDSTLHSVAIDAVEKRIADKFLCKQVVNIINSFDGDRGIGLGSQISQLIQLAVLDDLDHTIKETLHIKHYVRYMDDMILVHEDKEYLKHCLAVIKEELSKIGLELNKKTCICSLNQGIKWLQWKYLLTSSGKVVLKYDKHKIYAEKRKIKRYKAAIDKGKMTIETAERCFQSWLANVNRGNTYFQRESIMQYFDKIIKGINT